MTVGISVNNQKDKAVVAVDSRVGGIAGSFSDSAAKSSIVKGDTYAGVIFGSGDGLALTQGHQHGLKNTGLNEALDEFQNWFKHKVTSMIGAYTLADKEKLENLLSLLDPCRTNFDETKEGNVQLETYARILESVEREKQQRRQKLLSEFEQALEQMRTEFVVTAFDQQTERIVSYKINQNILKNVTFPQATTGSGMILAEQYMSSATTGLQGVELSINQLLCIAAGAYAHSTFTQSVGGTPKITIIDGMNCEELDARRTSMLTNLINAHEAKFVDRTYVDETVPRIMDGSKRVSDLARKLKMSEEDLTCGTKAYSEWCEKSNILRYQTPFNI